MANDTTAAASVQPMTAESAANAIEAMMSDELGEQQDQEAQQDESEDESEQQSYEDDDTVEDDADESDDEYDEESDEDVDEDQEDQPQSFTVKVDGKEVTVTLDELKQGYSRTEDYTRKTQALAQERKAAQAELEQVRTERQQYAQMLGALQQQLAQADQQMTPEQLNSLYESDPIEWMRQKEAMRERYEKQIAIQSEQQRLMQMQQAEQQQNMQRYLEGQKNALLTAMPQLRDPQVASVEKQRWIEAGKSIGFSDQELNGITDHRVLLALKSIADFNGLKAKRQQVKPNVSTKRVAKPGSSSNASQKSSSVKKSQQRLRSTGNVKDAASLIEQFL